VSVVPTLVELRTARLWSQRELARRAGVSQSTIVAIEAGERATQLLTMRRVANALDVDWLEITEFAEALQERQGKVAA
jgi:transcriptional regulator with XRE-family HTH domain